MSENKTQLMSAKDIVKQYLECRAKEDPLFAKSYGKQTKNLESCWSYIIGEARKRGAQVCMSDEEVFSLAVHYYDEDNIKVTPLRTAAKVTAGANPASMAKFTAKEKEKAKKEALLLYQKECLAEFTAKEKAKKKAVKHDRLTQPSLFDGF